MMSVTSWSSLVDWFAPHALNRILLTECLNRYDRRPRLHPRLLTLHLSSVKWLSPLPHLAQSLLFRSAGGPSPPAHCGAATFVTFSSRCLCPLLSATLSPSPLFQTWQFNAHAAEMARYAGRAKQHAEGRSGRHMLIWSLLLVRFANRAGGGAIRQVLNRKLSVAFQKLQFTAAEMTRQQFMMQGVLNRVHR